MTVDDTTMADAVPTELAFDQDVTMGETDPAVVEKHAPPLLVPAETLDTAASISERTSDSPGTDCPRSSVGWQEVDKNEVMSFCSDDSLRFDSEDEVSLPETEQEPSGASKPFDMGRLKACIQTGNSTLDKIAGKDVCLVIGKTGSGKSSLIQGISGKKFMSVDHEVTSKSEKFIKRVFEVDDPLEGFEIGHEKTSKTSAINCFERETGKKSEPEIMFYVDSPGFEDTNGLEVDIATSIMIAQVAKRCKSMRFIILINYASLVETRGDAMRAVLKIIRTFVQDFEAKKKSFAFLFSHTNELFPEDSKVASQRLHREIVHIYQGTTDEGVKVVLRCIKSSLEKKYPYVQIFHPLHFDFSRFTRFAESNKQLEPIENTNLTVNGALTVASQSTLIGEVRSNLLELKHLLSKSPADAPRVKDIKETLEYLGEYVGLIDINNAAGDCKEIIERFCRQEKSVVDEQIKRGTSLEEYFTIEDAEKLRNGMYHLSELKGFSAAHFANRMARALNQYKKSILTEPCVSFLVVARKLGSLQVWAHAFPEFKDFYDEALCHYNCLLASYEAKLSDFLSIDLMKATEHNLKALGDDFKVLGSVADHQESLSAYDLQVASVIGAFAKAKKHIQETISEWQNEADNGMQSNELSLEELVEFASRSKVLILLQGVLEKMDLGLKKKATSLIEDIKSRVVGYYQESARMWTTSGIACSRDTFQRITVLKTGASYFDELRGSEWRETRYACAAIIAVARSELSQMADRVSRNSQLVKDHGIRDAVADGQALLSLDDSVCFDELFDFKDRFLKNVSSNSHRKYNNRMANVQTQVNQSLKKLFDAREDSSRALEDIKVCFGEIRQISAFASAIGNEDFASMDDKLYSELRTFLEKMDRRTQTCLRNWHEALEMQSLDKLRAETAKLDGLLREMKQVSELGLQTESDVIYSHIVNALYSVKDKVDREFDLVGDFAILAASLACVEVLCEFPTVGQFLPAFEDYKDRVEDIVVEKAHAIEKLVETTAEWDQIDALVEDLEKATLIDQYIGGQASSRLGPLRKLREKKESDVDLVLEDLIANEDFKNIGELLAPLAQSKDQLKRKKFHGYGQTIVTRLKDEIHLAKSLLSANLTDESAQKIVRIVKVLDDAEAEIGFYLKSMIDLKYDIQRFRYLIDSKLNTVLTNFAEGSKDLNFARMAISKSRATKLVSFFGDQLSVGVKRKVTDVTDQYEKTLRSISVEIKKFFETGFSNDHELLRLLTGLRKGSESTHLATAQLTNLYMETTTDLEARIKTMLLQVERDVGERGCFDDGVALLQSFIGVLEGGLKTHIDSSTLPFECRTKLNLWRRSADDGEEVLHFEGPAIDSTLQSLSRKLDKLKSPSLLGRGLAFFSGDISYDKHCDRLKRQVNRTYSQATKALAAGDFTGVQKGIRVLELLSDHLVAHVPKSKEALCDLKRDAVEKSIEILESAVKVLNGLDLTRFERIFADIRSVALNISCISGSVDVMAKFSLVNQLVFEILGSQVSSVMVMLKMESDALDFSAVRADVENARIFGGFVADHYTLFSEEIKTEDKWLPQIVSLCHEHFSAGRDFSKIKYFAALGIIPSADEQEIKRAFKAKALQHHPDKTRKTDGDTGELFRKIKEAQDVLLTSVTSRRLDQCRPFDQQISRVNVNLRTKIKRLLDEERYDIVAKVLFRLSGLVELKDLVVPELDCGHIREGVEELVKDHVNKSRIEVQTLWVERKYRALNDTVSDLRSMENSLKSHSRVFSESWNDGIIQKIESEISQLGKEARELLSSEASAKANESEFRRIFIQMGHVLFELQALRDFTKRLMAEVLECCMCNGWGFSYVFELGLGLHRGNDDDDATAQVAHFILEEFSHFKEVRTMAWNTETTQKPVEDSVKRILVRSLDYSVGPLVLDHDALLRSFEIFEAEYNLLLGEYIRPDADKSALVNKVISICKKTQPVDCSRGWNQDVRDTIPQILGGVFALFTVCKSGESFNRIDSSEEAAKLGQQILLKPHNIQILTVLYMFGCDSPDGDDLESQLLQIRTGEGKSMILGAAATVLGLLGFKVRCVCYSEYLSNRDYALFADVFDLFGLGLRIKYSKITAFSEDTTASKGDIRSLTEALLRGKPTKSSPLRATRNPSLESLPSKIRITNGNSRQSSVALAQHQSHGTEDELEEQTSVETCAGGPSKDVLSLLRGTEEGSKPNEVILVDEVDVFFGSDFYGQTYNQAAQLREPEIRQILKVIWTSHKQASRRLRLSDIKQMDVYRELVAKFPSFEFVIENEISLMLDDVQRVDEQPYYLDSNDRIGYRVLDTISYDVTLGYRTAFAYLKEYDAGGLKDNDRTLEKVLSMNVSCAQFSYANIHPYRILGVSGTLDAMGDYEQNVLRSYGITKFIYMPSVYGKSNFEFEKTGDGIFIEAGQSDYYHKICSEICSATAKDRAVIVFFSDATKLNEFESSSFYRRLGRKKTKLTEDMEAAEKDFVIKKPATAGQLTICSGVFGRGTDFFCKDKKVQENGGVHIIQTFLSAEESEEIQVQGRTARQGKRGTYQLILLDSDLEGDFNVPRSFKDREPKKEWYEKLCEARDTRYDQHCAEMDKNLEDATKRDINSHSYFDTLLAADRKQASLQFKDIYLSMKKRPMPSCVVIDIGYVIDVTGSMSPYMKAARETIKRLLVGNGSIATKLKAKFPDVEFKLRVGSVAFRDIEDSNQQFRESMFTADCHFTESMDNALRFIKNETNVPSGGYDLAEDLFGAIHSCADWNGTDDWTAMVKLIMVVTDAPAHGLVPPCSKQVTNADNFPLVQPNGLTAESVVDMLVQKGIDLFFCSFNPDATAATEEKLSLLLLNHCNNIEGRELTRIPMAPKSSRSGGTPVLSSGYCQHIIFVLDESGSMKYEWMGVVAAYQHFLSRRLANQNSSDLVSVVQFQSMARVTVDQHPIGDAPGDLAYSGGGTCYSPAAKYANALALATPANSHKPVVIFMSDGVADETDALITAQIFKNLSQEVHRRWGNELELHVIAFGPGLDTRQLAHITRSSGRGKIHTSANATQLSDVFVEIAQSSSDVAGILEAEIGRRISQAVSDKVELEYLG